MAKPPQPRASNTEIQQFLQKSRAISTVVQKQPRLLFAIDATASRQPRVRTLRAAICGMVNSPSPYTALPSRSRASCAAPSASARACTKSEARASKRMSTSELLAR